MKLTLTLVLLVFGFAAFTPGQGGNKTPQQKDEKPIQLHATANPTTLDFGDQVVQTTSKSLKVTLTNNTGRPIGITTVDTSGEDFVVDTDYYEDDCAEETIEPGKSCNIRVVFFPLLLGQRTSFLLVTYDDADHPQKISLKGNSINSSK